MKPIATLFAATTPKYDWGSLCIDAWDGLGAFALVIPAALIAGGFSSIEAWFIFTALFMFCAGFIRGGRPGALWSKGIAIGVGASMLLFLLVHDADTAFVTILLTIGSATGGVFARRYTKLLLNR